MLDKSQKRMWFVYGFACNTVASLLFFMLLNAAGAPINYLLASMMLFVLTIIFVLSRVRFEINLKPKKVTEE